MNYGKSKASRKQKRITSKARMRKKRLGVRLFKGFLLCIAVCIVIGCAGGFLLVKKIIDDTPAITAASIKPQGYTTYVYADDGKTEIAKFITSGSNRVYVTIDQIPLNLQHAFVALEDSRFYTHNGIDPQGIARAAFIGITHNFHFSEGASTITQQLIKNNVFPEFVNEETLMDRVNRKVQEQYLALQLEQMMSKDDILEAYLNTINLGQNTLGVQSAANRYFNKDVSELTLSEAATIAPITQNPSKYNPVTHPEENVTRREKCLNDMLEQGYITQEEYDEAINDDVYSRIQNVNTKISEEENITNYFVDALATQLKEDMTSPDGLGFTDTQAYNYIYSGGLSVYSTENLALQKILEEEINDDSNYPSRIEWGVDYALTVRHQDGSVDNYSSGHLKKFGREKYGDSQGLLFRSKDAAKDRIEEFKKSVSKEGDEFDEYLNFAPQPQGSATLIDQYTGEVKAIVGGRGEKTTSRSLNRAMTSTRQPGSCFKILAVYAPAIDACGKTLATPIVDEPYKYSNGTEVNNWWGKKYRGSMTIRNAIRDSANICAVKMITEITPELGLEYCKKFGLTTLVDGEQRDYGYVTDAIQALALGGITDGVTNFEMAAAYASIANGGIYNKPILYTKVLDHDGNVLIDNTGKSKRVLKESTAALLTSAMEDVMGSQGTGYYGKVRNMACAGKTGTTSNDVDLWLCAYTPYYTLAVWTGYDDNKHMTGQWNFHLKMWKRIMERVHSNLPSKQFTMPKSVVKATVCKKTGMLPKKGCSTITEWFAADELPKIRCTGHKGVETVSDDIEEDYEEDDENAQPKPVPTPDQPSEPTPTPQPTPDPEPTPTPDPEPEPAPEPAPTPDPAPDSGSDTPESQSAE